MLKKQAKIEKANDEDIERFLSNHLNWSLKDDKLHKTFTFNNFVAAFGFMTQVAIIAESSDHHPEWFNVYRQVTIDLTTHVAKGITTRDFNLAEKIDGLLPDNPTS